MVDPEGMDPGGMEPPDMEPGGEGDSPGANEVMLHNEGEIETLEKLLKTQDTELLLYTNSTIVESTALVDITEPTGGGYARKTLTAASWTVETDGSGEASYAQQTFEPTGGDFTGDIYGWAVVNPTTARLIWSEPLTGSPAPPRTMLEGAQQKVTPVIVTATQL